SEKIRLIEQKLRDLSWQKFETFVEELLTYIQNNKSKVNALLMNLESKKDSLFGSKIVKIGGASNSDLVVFSLFEYLAPLLKSNNSFEVKKYNSSTLSIGDFHEAISHASTVNKIGVIIITTTSKVSTAAWTETIRGGGVIKPIIIDKGLLIRIIDWLDAYSIL
ncbi:MAG: hypothetical protein NTY48_04560, partial [Candidatus Diapherotrites archaeon]|nr:hypothetical protein [Candidatus Diapherotrites archaeon]